MGTAITQVALVILKKLIINKTTGSQNYWLLLQLFDHNYNFHITIYFNFNKLQISNNFQDWLIYYIHFFLEVTNDNFHGVHRLELYIVAFKKIIASLILVVKI